MDRKVTTIVITIIIILLIGTGAYFVFFAGKDDTRTGDPVGGTFPTGGEGNIDITPPIGLPDGGDQILSVGDSLIRLSDSPVACSVFRDGNVLYIEKATGHIYKTLPTGVGRSRFSNTTIPKVFDCLWSESGKNVVLSYFGENENGEIVRNFSAEFIVPLDGQESSEPVEIQGIFLPDEIIALASAPERDRLFYLAESRDVTYGQTANFSSEDVNQIFVSPYSQWNIDWVERNIISFLTKPSGDVEGFLYVFDPWTKNFEKLLGDIKGLTAIISPDGNKILYSESLNKTIKTYLYHRESGVAEPFQLTLPEKCVFSDDSARIYCAISISVPLAFYPDDWYQGTVSFSDSLWVIDLEKRTKRFLLDNTRDFDIINLTLSDNEEYLVFTNKKDSSLWSLGLVEFE